MMYLFIAKAMPKCDCCHKYLYVLFYRCHLDPWLLFLVNWLIPMS